jgi:hypothetical protein
MPIRSIHGVESGNFINLYRGHLEDLSNLVHGSKRNPVITLRVTKLRKSKPVSEPNQEEASQQTSYSP